MIPNKGLKVVMFDLDGTLTRGTSSIWRRLHIRFGTESVARGNLEKFFRNEITYKEWVVLDSKLWKGFSYAEAVKVATESVILEGAREMADALRACGIHVGILSGGLDVMAHKVADVMGIPYEDVYTNELGHDPETGLLTGFVSQTVLWDNKGELLAEFAHKKGVDDMSRVGFVGDGENDIFAFRVAGMSVAYNSSKDEVKQAAKTVLSGSEDLRDLLRFLLPPAKILWVGESVFSSPERDLSEEERASLADVDHLYCYPSASAVKLASEKFRFSEHNKSDDANIIHVDDRLCKRIGKRPENMRPEKAVLEEAVAGISGVDLSHVAGTVPWNKELREPLESVGKRAGRLRAEIMENVLRPGEICAVLAPDEVLAALTPRGKDEKPYEFAGFHAEAIPMYSAYIPKVRVILDGDNDAELKEMEEQQARLRKEVEELMTRYPKSGVYKGETDADWDAFYEHVNKVFDAEGGPRGDVIKEIRAELHANEEKVRPVLEMLGCTVDTPAPEIARRFNQYPRGSAWASLNTFKSRVNTAKQVACEIGFEDCPITVQIVTGISKKAGMEVALKRLEEIRADKLRVYYELVEKLKAAEERAARDEEYQRVENMSNVLGDYVARWSKVDVGMGYESNARGCSFEDLCFRYASKYVMHKLGVTCCVVARNLMWKDSAGETDIVLLDEAQTRVLAIIECKACLFDIAIAHTQSAPEFRKRDGKEWLILGSNTKSCIRVDDDVPSFVVTVIPPHDYILGFDSHVKTLYQCLIENPEYTSSHMIRDALRESCGDNISPNDWIIKYGTESLIVYPN